VIEVVGSAVSGERLIGAACTLDAEAMPARVAEWRALRERASEIQHVAGGRTLILAAEEPMAAVADLAARESECCAFYTFTLVLDGPTRELQITAGPGEEPAVEVLLGLI
jgi:hypothetical protein